MRFLDTQLFFLIGTRRVFWNSSVHSTHRDLIDLLIQDRATFDKIYSRMEMEIWLTNNEVKKMSAQVAATKAVCFLV